MRKRAFVVVAAVLLTACGNAKNEAVVSAGGAVEEASALENTGAESDGTDEQEVDDCSWKSGYRKNVEDLYKNGYDDSFSLYDLNNDGIPEIFLSVDSDSNRKEIMCTMKLTISSILPEFIVHIRFMRTKVYLSDR
ncbi:MAG: hypothetical protein J5504_05960 [Butyrivibrio sp.]|nr:hypothetical protein [Butyrivibrio sp.]